MKCTITIGVVRGQWVHVHPQGEKKIAGVRNFLGVNPQAKQEVNFQGNFCWAGRVGG